MEFLTKIKILSLILVGVGLVCAWYWWHGKRKEASISSARTQFRIPTEMVKKVILDNGMTVLVFKKESNPKVLVQIAYNVGSAVEESGERGLAHLLEHMIFKGTEKLSEGDIDAIARKYGASFNAYTSMDMTSYYFETNKNNWKPFVEMLADCMQNTRFDEQHLASEIKAVIQELRMLKDNYSRLMFLKACELAFPPNHPYHTPVIGYREDLLNLSAANLKKFYQKYYQPERATLFIVGDVDIDLAIDIARKSFEPIKSEKTPQRTQDLPMVNRELVMHNTRMYEDVKKELLGFYWVIPGIKAKDEILPSAVSDLLGRGEGSRLYRILVDEKKYATSVYVSALKFMEAGVFLIYLEPVEGKNAECRAVIEQELKNIMKSGVLQNELQRMIKYQSRTFLEKLENIEEFTDSWIRSYFATGDEFDVFKRVEKYAGVTSEQVQAFVSQYLDPFMMHQIDLCPLPVDKKELREKLKKISDEFEQTILKKYVRTTPIEDSRFVHQIPDPASLQFVFPKADRVVALDNGLKVLLRRRNNAPLVSLNVHFKDGAFFEASQEGITVYLMMSMLMEGSKDYSKEELVTFFENYGADYNFDSQGARFDALAEDFMPLAQRFFSVLTTPVFPKDAFEKTKNIFIHNFESSKDSAQAVSMRLLHSVIYKNHAFSWSFDDAIALLKKTSVQDLVNLHKKQINASNIVVSVVGDFDLNVMEKAVKKLFGQLPAGQRVICDYKGGTFTPQEKIDQILLRDQVVLILGQSSSLDVYHPDLVPVRLLNIISFYSLGSRLYQLREQSGLFYHAFGRIGAKASKFHGLDYVGAVLSPENVEPAENKIRAMMQEIADKGFTENEMKAARQLYLKDLIDAVSENSSIANMFNYLEEMELGEDYYDKVLQRIQTMPLADLNGIAKKYMNTDKMARIRVGRVK